MSYQLPANPDLITPEYWGGIDITNPNHFMGVPDTLISATRKEHRTAAENLACCLQQVIRGDFVETGSLGNEFSPSPSTLADGTVVVIDCEHLMKWTYPNEDIEWQAPDPVGKGIPIQAPFAEHWKNQQSNIGSSTESQHFGDERASFPELHTLYGRYLEWGVLFSRTRKETDEVTRYLATWAFCAAKAGPKGLYVPHGGNVIFRRIELLPIDVGAACARPELDIVTCGIRAIERVREVKTIHPANGNREKSPSLRERIGELAKGGLGKIVLPSPRPVPVPGF